ncbi:MAG: hypothetical protein J6X37_04355 [Treponema sp.]|uniref:hypothetical protein n=1 Tax=Treponema sp. TaxID=166 RepID=UPI001B5B2A04|nr:hypothetical protein [Treponema sp.]MBP5587937.1 hypothetical protein [Treponema sp.]MCR5387270.1 hypothetical protein [Treponema sp.]
MAISKVTVKKNGYKLKGALKKNGLDCWRYFFNARSIATGSEAAFFIELLVENPAVSPDEFVLTQKSRPKIKADDLQAALTGNIDVKDQSAEEAVIPSFVAVRAGIYGEERKQINCFYPPKRLKCDKRRFCMEVEDNLFSDDTLSGALVCSKSDSVNYPEYMSQAGSISWNLHYERMIDFDEISDSQEENFWLPGGVICNYSGRIVLDEEEYAVSPKSGFGYCDKIWGKTIPAPFYHLSSNKLTSIFSGKLIENGCFSLQGLYQNKLSFISRLGEDIFNFSPTGKFNKYDIVYNCIPVPGEEDDEQLHWSVSIHNKLYVCDVDIFCSARLMLVRDYELPYGNHKVQKILSGSEGNGELRIYKKIKKNLELIHHAKIENCVCEFGNVE